MDDIDEVIKMAGQYDFEEARDFRTLNRISSLSSSKSKMKRALKERIRILTAGYISLATFVDDDLVDFLEANFGNEDKRFLKKKSRIYKDVLRDMEKAEREMREFNPFGLIPNPTREY